MLPTATSDTTVLITGASSGFGVEFADQLAARGYSLILTARREKLLEEVAERITNKYGVSVQVVTCDLADAEARMELVDKVLAKSGKLIGLCNNAGFGNYAPVLEADPEGELQMLRLNVEALTDLTQRLLPTLVSNSPAAVLNVASTAAFMPIPRMAGYAATKAYVLAYSEALHSELEGTGVSCSTLCPGPSQTEFSQVAGNQEMFARMPNFLMVDPKDVVAEGVKAMISGKRVAVPGKGNRILATASKLVPRRVLIKRFK